MRILPILLALFLLPFAGAYSGFSGVQKLSLSDQRLQFQEAEQTKTITLIATDGAIYNTYYTSFDDGKWTAHNFTSTPNKGWIIAGSASATVTVPKGASTENYLIVYSCTKSGIAWDCHDNAWQILQVNTTLETCVPNSNECGSDGCGASHDDCSLAHATAICDAGFTCKIASCAQGYADCDDERLNGCETALGTSNDCASCNDACPSGQACSDGQCSDTDCAPMVSLGGPAVFKATFENKTTKADVGSQPIDNRNGGAMSVVANPSPAGCAPSESVLYITIPATASARAEYHSQRLPVAEKTYIYTWKQYLPVTLLDAHPSEVTLSQWKTYPCSKNGGFSEQICFSGGIFNDIRLAGGLLEYRYRAQPDCSYLISSASSDEGSWHTFVYEISWTQTDDGYYRLYRDGELLGAKSGVQTLFDNITLDGSCNLYWGSGLYAPADATGTLELYLDDIAIFDEEDVALQEVCPACEEPGSDGCFSGCCPFSPDSTRDGMLSISDFDDECDWTAGELDTTLKMQGTSSLSWDFATNAKPELVLEKEYNDLSEGTAVSVWVHNDLAVQGESFTILFYSENASTSGIDYYSLSIPLNFTGWSEITIPKPQYGVRKPLGWDRISRVSLRADWSGSPNPSRIVHLDRLQFTSTPS